MEHNNVSPFFLTIDLQKLSCEELTTIYATLPRNDESQAKTLERLRFFIQDAFDLTEEELDNLRPKAIAYFVKYRRKCNSYNTLDEAMDAFYANESAREVYSYTSRQEFHTHAVRG